VISGGKCGGLGKKALNLGAWRPKFERQNQLAPPPCDEAIELTTKKSKTFAFHRNCRPLTACVAGPNLAMSRADK
jgi:hypothetical protein